MLSPSLTSSGVDKYPLSSPYPLKEHSFVFGYSPPPVMLCFPKSDMQISETETPPDQDLSPPTSLLALVCEYLPPCSSSTALQNVTHSQCPTILSPSSFNCLSPTSSPMQPASFIGLSKEIKTEDKDAPSPHLSTLFHDGTPYSTFSSVPLPVLSLSPSTNLNCPFSASIAMLSIQSDYSSGSPGNTQSERTEVVLHENSPSASGGLLSLLPSSPYLPPSAPFDFHCPSSLASPPLIESLSQSPVNNQKDSLFPESVGMCLSVPPTYTQKEKKETPSSLSFQLDKDNFLAPPALVLESSKFENGCATLSCLSPNCFIPVCQSALSSQSHDPDGLIDPAVGKISNLTEQSISQQDRPYFHDDNTDSAPASPFQDVICVKVDHLSLDLEDTLQRNGKEEVEGERKDTLQRNGKGEVNCEKKDTLQRNGKREVEGERHTDTVQTREAIVYISDTESSAGLSEGSKLLSKEVCNQTEIDPQVPSFSLHDELSTETKPEELKKVCQMGINGSESESPRSSLVLHDKVPESHNRSELEPKDLVEIESLDLVFQTSVDGSEGENGDVDDFFQQLDTEGRIYWAEPILVSNPTPVLEESCSFEVSDGSPGNAAGPSGLNSFSSTGRAMHLSLSSSTAMDSDQTSRSATASSNTHSSLTLAPFPSPSATPDCKPSNRSVTVQMSSSPTSHIIHRKDVPYMTDSKRTLLPSILPLDTTTPFHAVKSWTDLQIQRNTLTKKLSHGALHIVPDEVTKSTGASESTQRRTLIFSPFSSFPPLSNDWQSHDCLPRVARNYCTVSVSVDKGLWPDEDEDMDRNGNEEEEKLWTKTNQTATMACCCSCDHQCCCTQKGYSKEHSLSNFSVSNTTHHNVSLFHLIYSITHIHIDLRIGVTFIYSL